MLGTLLQLLERLAAKLINCIFPNDLRVEVFMQDGKMVLRNEGSGVLYDLIVSSVSSESAAEPSSLEEAFAMQQKIPAPGFETARYGWEISNPAFRVRFHVLEPGEYWAEKPALERRRDENCRFELSFVDSRGRAWIKRHLRGPVLALLRNGFHKYSPESLPTTYSELHRMP